MEAVGCLRLFVIMKVRCDRNRGVSHALFLNSVNVSRRVKHSYDTCYIGWEILVTALFTTSFAKKKVQLAMGGYVVLLSCGLTLEWM